MAKWKRRRSTLLQSSGENSRGNWTGLTEDEETNEWIVLEGDDWTRMGGVGGECREFKGGEFVRRRRVVGRRKRVSVTISKKKKRRKEGRKGQLGGQLWMRRAVVQCAVQCAAAPLQDSTNSGRERTRWTC